jgi:16S rRNA (uracil1498-N3)-methyltransferase
MQFLYHAECGLPSLILEGDAFHYAIKVRRVKAGSLLDMRNLHDANLYNYRVTDLDRRTARLELVEQKEYPLPGGDLHIGWCVIDPKTVEKALPMLNQTGVRKITFIDCAYSQSHFKASRERLEKILISSCEQSGRSTMMTLAFADSLNAFLEANPNCAILDFNPNTTFEAGTIDTILIGCEGGFSEKERTLFAAHPVVSFDTPLILRSETAAVSAASKILL